MASAMTAREALIPMVDRASAGAVARVAADGELVEPHAAQLDRSLCELLESGLYKAGQQAKAAARLVKLPGRGWLRSESEALHVNNPGDIIGLGAENSASAELGMALALLMYRSQSDSRAVLATGALELGYGGRDVPILPVHHLEQKLRTVVRYFSQPGAASAPRLFLVPQHDPDGAPVLERYGPEKEALNGVGVDLHGVGTLTEAANLVGARRYAVWPAERRLRRLVAAAAAGAVGLAAFNSWYNSSIALSFATTANPDGTISATPGRYQRGAATGDLLPPCRIAGIDTPGFVIGEQMAVRLRTGNPHDLASWLGGYQHVLVSISSTSGAKVLPLPGPRPVAAGAETGYLLDVRQPEEETLLVWLAKRGPPFDTTGLEARLRATLQPLQPAERMSAARNLLRKLAPGSLFYSFRSASAGSCS
jgi:hypothetical protein